jgi:hypothetical protein
MRCMNLALVALAMVAAPALTGPAVAQQRVVVVPAGADIVIPPRGVDGPPLVRAPRPRLPAPGQPAAQPMTRPMLEAGGGGSAGLGLAAPSLIALPLIAAAALAASVPGNSSSSGTSAPARTR